ncbi:MAG: lipopolysaccharide heptosyltransferase II [Planctomycetota bacterium]|nr:MAG: lipopolysaccharide heptosyltransferase II [Planctomycetota bacterium]
MRGVAAAGTLLVDTSFLGDVLCAEPLVRAAAARWPGEPVDFLTSPGAAPLLANHPDLREVLVFAKRGADRGPGGLFRLARRLRRRGYARAICSHRSWRTALLLRASGIPERRGFANASLALAYNRKIQYRKDLHEIERNLELVGGGAWEPPRVHPSESERRRAAELTPDRPFVALAPGSIWATKRWPEEHFSAVAAALRVEGRQVVLLGGADDRPIAERIAAAAPGCLDLTGRTSLRESYAVLERAAVLLTNDSFPMHLGVAAGIPVVAVYCSTLPSFGFAPRGLRDRVLEVADLSCRPCGIHGRRRCPEGHFRCGRDLAPDRALAAIRERLGT